MSCCIMTVSTGEVAIIEYFGKFSRISDPGLICLCAPFEYIVGRQSLRVQQLTVECETKTKDNNPHQQLTAYVYDVIRASLPGMDLDQAFESKDDISRSLKHHLEEVMSTYGFLILQALVTEMIPDQRVRNAMNEINASKRLKEAATQRAEGEKIVKVKKAEAEAESMYLSGVGVARQRKAIMDGFRDNLVEFTSSVDGSTSKEILDLLVLNQYFDTLHDVASNPATKCVFLSNDSGPSEMRNSILQANASAGY